MFGLPNFSLCPLFCRCRCCVNFAIWRKWFCWTYASGCARVNASSPACTQPRLSLLPPEWLIWSAGGRDSRTQRNPIRRDHLPDCHGVWLTLSVPSAKRQIYHARLSSEHRYWCVWIIQPLHTHSYLIEHIQYSTTLIIISVPMRISRNWFDFCLNDRVTFSDGKICLDVLRMPPGTIIHGIHGKWSSTLQCRLLTFANLCAYFYLSLSRRWIIQSGNNARIDSTIHSVSKFIWSHINIAYNIIYTQCSLERVNSLT